MKFSPKSKSPSKLSTKLSTTVLCTSLLSAFVVLPACADSYHAVETGETLSSVAKRFGVSTDALRAANKLSLSDNATLGEMLLRIPGEAEQTEIKLPTPRASTPVMASASSGRYFGSVTKYVAYTVQNGDTLESIAAKFSGGAQAVSAGEISRRNDINGALAAGSTLQIPVTTKYASPTRVASSQVAPQVKNYSTPVGGSDRADVNVSVSEEMQLPFASAVPTNGTPLYQSPSAPRVESQPTVQATTQAAPRGGTVLSARGGYSPNINRRRIDGARVLQNGEEVSTVPSPQVTAQTEPNNRLARVAKIAHNGARIRRLPDSGAVTLYKCATGTEIAVLKQKGPWSAILMSDRSTGWIPSHYLQFTKASVDVSTQVITDNSSDADNDWREGYTSNHPAVVAALKWLGTRYVYGGEGRNGIDCSSLVQHSFASCGVRLPRTAAEQARVGRPVSPENLQPGDRLYFSASGTRIDHTGLYMGNGLFVQASGHARRVVVSKLSEPRSWNIFVCARR